MMNNFGKKIFSIAIFVMILTFIAIPDGVFAKTKRITEGGIALDDYIDISYDKSINKAIDDITVTIRSGQCPLKYYFGAPNGVNDITDFFKGSGATFDKGFEKIDIASSVSKKITFNRSTEIAALVVTVDGDCPIKQTKKKLIKLHEADFYMNNAGAIKLRAKNKDAISATGVFEYFTGRSFDAEIAETQAENKSYDLNHLYNTRACKAFRKGCYKNSKNDEKCTSENKKDIDVWLTNKKEKNKDWNNSWALAKAQGDQNPTFDDFRNKASAYFPFCFDTRGNIVNLSSKMISKVRKKFIDYYEAVANYYSFVYSEDNQKYQSIVESYDKNANSMAFWEKVEDTRLKSDIMCSPDAKDPETRIYHYTKNAVKNPFCSVDCVEKLTVTYSPPQVVKAGLCFTYKVTVKSKVDCGITTNKNLKFNSSSNKLWPANPYNPEPNGKPCVMVPTCSGGTDQAGPNDEYDQCIDKCDGGKYSQKCTNKCYKKVYQSLNKKENKRKVSTTKNNINTKLLDYSSNNSSNVKLLSNDDLCDSDDDECFNANNENPYYVYYHDGGKKFNIKNGCNSAKALESNLEICAKAFTEAKSNRPCGQYKKDGPGYSWNPGSGSEDECDGRKIITEGTANYVGRERSGNGVNSVIQSMRRAAPYYLANVSRTKELLKSLIGWDTGENNFGTRYYNIDENGVKRQVSKRWKCHEQCYFHKSSDSNDCKTHSHEIEVLFDDKNDLISKNTKDMNECKKVKDENCSTKEATFYISAENESLAVNEACTNDKESVKKQESTNATKKEGEVWTDANKKYVCSYYNSNKPGSEYSKKLVGDDIFVAVSEQIEEINRGITLAGLAGEEYLKWTDTEPDSNGVNGVCYGEATGALNQSYASSHQYKTTITFPGDYVNMKTGEVVHNSDENVTTHKNKFCTFYDSKSVNEEYYRWFNSENRSDSDTYSGSIENWNIRSQISNFGKYNWSFDTKCFYALGYNTKDTPDCPEGPGYCKCLSEKGLDTSSCTDLDNYEIRNVSLDKLFPDGHTTGFNWTEQATNTFGGEVDASKATANGTKKYNYYDLNPAEYAKSIIDKGDRVYSDKSVYEFTLTPGISRQIKSDIINKDYGGDLSKFAGKYTKKNIGAKEWKFYNVYDRLNSLIGNPNSALDIGYNHNLR